MPWLLQTHVFMSTIFLTWYDMTGLYANKPFACIFIHVTRNQIPITTPIAIPIQISHKTFSKHCAALSRRNNIFIYWYCVIYRILFHFYRRKISTLLFTMHLLEIRNVNTFAHEWNCCIFHRSSHIYQFTRAFALVALWVCLLAKIWSVSTLFQLNIDVDWGWIMWLNISYQDNCDKPIMVNHGAMVFNKLIN